MNRLLVVVDDPAKTDAIKAQLSRALDLEFLPVEGLWGRTPDADLLLDINLRDEHGLLSVREWLKHRKARQNLIFMVDRASRIDMIQAAALEATDIYPRPVDLKAILNCLLGDFDGLILDASHIREFPAVGPALDALENIFAASRFGDDLNPRIIDGANERLSEHIDKNGIGQWLEVVRNHHSQTYQHCLVVVGIMAAFCHTLGFSGADRRRMTVGALLHDIGKVHVPVSILEKPGPLDQNEWAIMRQHPELGLDTLRTIPQLSDDAREMALHHHEMLDGSGYPHQLHTNAISDAVRIMTICDVFGALIEHRSYRPPLSGEAAFKTMLDMGSKLDQHLLREFRRVAVLTPPVIH
jgi:putative nucleotidyltransferase with HDIG domain